MIYLWMTAGLVLLDQLVKFWAETQVQPVATIVLLPGLFSFTYAKNAGASFSMLEGQRVLFICITVLAVGALVWTLAAYREKLTPVLRLALFFVLAGALGNFIDRCLHGAVVDMFELTFIRFPIFNVADIAVTIGGALLAWGVLVDKRGRALVSSK